jgi:hypothetical protein
MNTVTPVTDSDRPEPTLYDSRFAKVHKNPPPAHKLTPAQRRRQNKILSRCVPIDENGQRVTVEGTMVHGFRRKARSRKANQPIISLQAPLPYAARRSAPAPLSFAQKAAKVTALLKSILKGKQKAT